MTDTIGPLPTLIILLIAATIAYFIGNSFLREQEGIYVDLIQCSDIRAKGTLEQKRRFLVGANEKMQSLSKAEAITDTSMIVFGQKPNPRNYKIAHMVGSCFDQLERDIAMADAVQSEPSI